MSVEGGAHVVPDQQGGRDRVGGSGFSHRSSAVSGVAAWLTAAACTCRHAERSAAMPPRYIRLCGRASAAAGDRSATGRLPSSGFGTHAVTPCHLGVPRLPC